MQHTPEPSRNARMTTDVGIVVIGRNEGERLKSCLASLAPYISQTVYVDSGSSDNSVEHACEMGAIVVDLSGTFTAARARNAGFRALIERWPHISFVQFVDGDCTLVSSWINAASEFLSHTPNAALVFGRRRERYPGRSTFNRLCDREWDGRPGSVLECGGDILVRADLLKQSGGYRDHLIAGEEPELCVRLREMGYTVWRLDHEMTLHDADMTRFSQWWRRSVRAGHAFAEVSRLHRNTPTRIWSRNVSRAVGWGALLPSTALIGALIYPPLLALLVFYPLQIGRIVSRQNALDRSAWTNAVFDVLGKFPEFQGISKFYINDLFQRKQTIIEYK